MVETHAHIYLDQFKEELEEVLDRAKDTVVDEIYMPNIDHTTIDDMLEVESRYPQCIGMMGHHP